MPTARQASRRRRRLRASLGTTPIFTSDVGPGGFSAEVLRVQAPGTPVEGSFRLNGEEVTFRGVIAWAKAGAPLLGLRGRVGVRFTMEPGETRLLLVALSMAGVI